MWYKRHEHYTGLSYLEEWFDLCNNYMLDGTINHPEPSSYTREPFHTSM